MFYNSSILCDVFSLPQEAAGTVGDSVVFIHTFEVEENVKFRKQLLEVEIMASSHLGSVIKLYI